jgi:hypothetical protein
LSGNALFFIVKIIVIAGQFNSAIASCAIVSFPVVTSICLLVPTAS